MYPWTVRNFGHFRREPVWWEIARPKADGTKPADILNLSGTYPIKASVPFSPGMERCE